MNCQIRPGLAVRPQPQDRFNELVRPVVSQRLATGWSLATCTQGQTVWRDSSDHSKSYGRSAAGPYVWDVNLFVILNFFTASVFGAVGAYSEVLTLNLLDKSGSVIKTATGNASYTVTTGGAWNSIALTGLSWTFDSTPVTEFNALQCINTGSTPSGPGFLTGIAGVQFITDYIHQIGTQP